MKLIIKKKQLVAIVILCYNFQYRKLVTTYCIYNGLLILDVMVERPSKNGVSFNCKGVGIINDDGEEVKAEVHWFQEESIGKVKIKVKEWLDES